MIGKIQIVVIARTVPYVHVEIRLLKWYWYSFQ